MNDATSKEAAPLFEAFEEAAKGLDNRIVFEAAATIATQAICHGSFTLEQAKTKARQCGKAMERDIERNWALVIAARKRGAH